MPRGLVAVLVLVCGGFMAIAGQPPTTWYVDDGTCPESGSGTEKDPFCLIQDCIEAAMDGDECVVAPGTYFETINLLGKAITLRGAEGPEITIIDAEGSDSVVRMVSGEGPGTTLEGFTIRNGDNNTGGGVQIADSSPTISNCVLTANTAAAGGGIYINSGSPMLTSCSFLANTTFNSGVGGAGIYVSGGCSPTVMNSSFSQNTSRAGAGIYVGGGTTVSVIDSLFEFNEAARGGAIYVSHGQADINGSTFIENTASDDGGAIRSVGTGALVNVTNSTFSGNTADAGGGALSTDHSTLALRGCQFFNNTASHGGALAGSTQGFTAISCAFIANEASENAGAVTIVGNPYWINCLFVGNHAGQDGGALRVGNSTFINTTISSNTANISGGGIQLGAGSTIEVSNSILWGNTDSTGQTQTSQIAIGGGTAIVNFSNIQGLTRDLGGTGNIDADPLFFDPGGSDFHLSAGSSCIDAADNTAVPGGIVTDLDGYARFVDDLDTTDTGNPDGLLPIVDMGAYEFGSQDCNNNGTQDVEDIANGTSQDCNVNGVPDECEPDCNENAQADSCDIAEGTSEDCNGNTVPDECDIANNTSEDCNGNTVPDECDIANSTSEDCTGNGVPDECESDCNENGQADSCDIAEGTSEDCNGNTVPDECDIGDGTSEDCNTDGVPDECESDCFENGSVLSHQKISDTEGGFTGILDNRDMFGNSVASLGDLDGDGVGDLAVGAIVDGDGGFAHGAVWILFLNTDGTVKSHQKISDTEGGFTGKLDGDQFGGDQFGDSVASLGDLDGDGVADLAVGAIGDDDGGFNHGAVWILFLNTDGTVKSHQKISDTEGGFTGILDNRDQFGNSVASLADLDGDGVGDLAVGAVLDDEGGNSPFCGRGAVWILFLNTDGTVKSHQKINDTHGGFTGTLDDGDRFGVSVASLGDLDGDGVSDLAVGAKGDDDGGLTVGAMWVLFLDTDGTVKSHQKISDTAGGFTGILGRGDGFGNSVASLGDLDGDGVADLAVGARGDDDGGPVRGAVWVLFLNTDGTVKRHQKISDTGGGFTGVLDDFDFFGTSVASLGDLDGDGVADLAVGADGDADGGFDRGAVWVLFLDGCGDCPTDVDGNGQVEAFDLANLLGAWGPVTPGSVCLDADGNGSIEAFDLAVLLGDWGPCP